MFNQPSVIGAAMNALSVRNDVIQNNIANIDTVNFKKSEVFFEESLQKAVENMSETGELDLSHVRPQISRVHENFSQRLDGNNVDVDTEMAYLYQNGLKYETLAAGIMNYYKRINSVLLGR
jgi:flagellar basal-body rod protein FlgB